MEFKKFWLSEVLLRAQNLRILADMPIQWAPLRAREPQRLCCERFNMNMNVCNKEIILKFRRSAVLPRLNSFLSIFWTRNLIIVGITKKVFIYIENFGMAWLLLNASPFTGPWLQIVSIYQKMGRVVEYLLSARDGVAYSNAGIRGIFQYLSGNKTLTQSPLVIGH